MPAADLQHIYRTSYSQSKSVFVKCKTTRCVALVVVAIDFDIVGVIFDRAEAFAIEPKIGGSGGEATDVSKPGDP